MKLFPSIVSTHRSSQRDHNHNLVMLAAPVEFNWKQNKKSVEDKMSKSIDSIQLQFNTLRAGGANPAILDRVFVDYFGSQTPLNQVARVGSSGSQQLVIEPFDKSALKDIEKAIATSGLNLTPNNDGSLIRINIPPLTEDRRKDLIKQSKTIAEDGKVAIRNIRSELHSYLLLWTLWRYSATTGDVVDKIKAAEKDKTISKDDSKGFQDDLQKVTDGFIKKIDDMTKSKEKDLLTI